MVAGVNSAGMLFPSLTIMTTGSAVLTTPFQGVVIAPNGSIDLGGSSNLTLVHRGAFFGKTVTLFEKARLFHYRDAYSFRGFGPNNGTPFIGDRVSVTGGSIRLTGAEVTDEFLQSETATAISRNGSNVLVTVGYNDQTNSPTNPTTTYPDGRSGIHRVVTPGVSQMGWSYSTDGGHTFSYGGRVTLPSGIGALWGDPAMAKLNIDDPNVYYAAICGTTASFGSQPVVDRSPNLAGHCVARSTDRGITFPTVACVGDSFSDGTELAVASNSTGGHDVYLSANATSSVPVWRMNGETMAFTSLPNPSFPGTNFFPLHAQLRVSDGILYVLTTDNSGLLVGNSLDLSTPSAGWRGGQALASGVSLVGGVAELRYARPFSFDVGPNGAGVIKVRVMFVVNDSGAAGQGLSTVECEVNLTNCVSLGWSTIGHAGDEALPSLRFGGGRWVAAWLADDLSIGATFVAGQLDQIGGAAVLTQRTIAIPAHPCATGLAYWGDFNEIDSFGDGRFFAGFTVNGPGCRWQGKWTSDQHVGGSVFGF